MRLNYLGLFEIKFEIVREPHTDPLRTVGPRALQTKIYGGSHHRFIGRKKPCFDLVFEMRSGNGDMSPLSRASLLFWFLGGNLGRETPESALPVSTLNNGFPLRDILVCVSW